MKMNSFWNNHCQLGLSLFHLTFHCVAVPLVASLQMQEWLEHSLHNVKFGTTIMTQNHSSFPFSLTLVSVD